MLSGHGGVPDTAPVAPGPPSRPDTRTPLVRLALLSGSLRSGSLNTAALRAAADIALTGHQVAEARFLPIGALPLFNADREAESEVGALAAALRRADGLLISTPEYNGHPPGVLMNALDWLSSGLGDRPITSLPVATLSASPGSRGALRAQRLLRDVLGRCGARVVGEPVPLERAAQSVDVAGEFTDPQVRERITAAVTALVACHQQQGEVSRQ